MTARFEAVWKLKAAGDQQADTGGALNGPGEQPDRASIKSLFRAGLSKRKTKTDLIYYNFSNY